VVFPVGKEFSTYPIKTLRGSREIKTEFVSGTRNHKTGKKPRGNPEGDMRRGRTTAAPVGTRPDADGAQGEDSYKEARRNKTKTT